MSNASSRERLRQAQERARRGRRRRTLAILGVVVGALIAIGISVWAAVRNDAGPLTAPPNATAARDGIVVNPGKAQPGAPAVGLYADYQCSHCVVFEEKYGLVLADLAAKGEIQLVHHTRVFLDKGNPDGLSHKAALAAACADVAGKHAAYSEGIFAAARRGPYADALFRELLPRDLGIAGESLTAFQQCYDTKALAGWVDGVEEASAKAGITATPTLLVNGKPVDLTTLPDDAGRLRDVILAAR